MPWGYSAIAMTMKKLLSVHQFFSSMPMWLLFQAWECSKVESGACTKEQGSPCSGWKGGLPAHYHDCSLFIPLWPHLSFFCISFPLITIPCDKLKEAYLLIFSSAASLCKLLYSVISCMQSTPYNIPFYVYVLRCYRTKLSLWIESWMNWPGRLRLL